MSREVASLFDFLTIHRFGLDRVRLVLARMRLAWNVRALPMMLLPMILLTGSLLGAGWPNVARGADDPVLQQVAQWDAESKQLAAEVDVINQKLRDARKQVAEAESRWKQLLGRSERLERRCREVEQELGKQRSQLAKAQAAIQKQAADRHKQGDQQQVKGQEAEQQQESTESQQKDQEKPEDPQQIAAKCQERIEQLERELQACQQEQKDVEPMLPASAKRSQRLEAVVAELEGSRRQLEQEITDIQVRIQERLMAEGRWVSFRSQVAPILQEHCLVCHNPRQPMGGYNLNHFAGVHTGGESGPALVTGQPSDSLLWQLIEEGSMPLEAEALSAQQTELIRQWIELGARLDTGVQPDTPLVRLLPGRSHPQPPQQYAAPLPVTALALDPTGRQLLSSGYHELLVWEAGQARLEQRVGDLAQRIYAIDFHPQGRWLAVAAGTPGRWGEVKLLDLSSESEPNGIRQPGSWAAEPWIDLWSAADAMFDVAFSPDGNRLAAAGADGAVVVFELEAVQKQRHAEPGSGPTPEQWLWEDHADWVQRIAWSPDSQRLASASRDKTAKVFDVTTGQLVVTFHGHSAGVGAVAFLEQGQHVASGGHDRQVRIWKASDGKEVRKFGGLEAAVEQMLAMGDDRLLIGDGDRLVLHSVADGSRLRTLTLGSEGGLVTSLVLDGDGRAIYTGNMAGEIQRLEWLDENGQPLGENDQDPNNQKRWLAIPERAEEAP